MTPPSFSLGTTWVDVGTATCADSFVSAEIALFLEEFHYPLQFALGGAWEPDPPVSPVSLGTHGGAAAVDALLESWEMQSTCDALCGGHVLTAEFVDLSYPFGLAATYSTEDDPIVDDESWDVQSHLPGDLPFSDDGLDPNGDPFDFLAALSTSALSQVLTARADTDLAFNPADEWSDLGLDPVSFGLAPNAALVLNGTSMGAWSPTFSGLGRHAVEMALVPSIAPWAWMPPDPPDYVPGEYPVSVSLPQMQLTLTERRGGNVVTWLTAAVDFHDSDLQVGFGDGPFASITLGSPTVYVTVTQSRLTSTCPMVAHGNTALNVSTACERQMEVALADLIQPQLEARIEAILAEVPIPLPFWPASVETTVNTSFVWQEDQFVSYYAVFN